MRNCQQIVDLVSQEIDGKLPWKIHLEVKMHLVLCNNCHRYTNQLNFMQSELNNIEQHLNSVVLSEPAKKRIQQSLNLTQSGNSHG